MEWEEIYIKKKYKQYVINKVAGSIKTFDK